MQPDFNLAKLADAARIQRPYLSKVLNGYANLSRDQLFLACKCLEFDQEEMEFTHLLWDRESTQVDERRALLQKEIDGILRRKRSIGKALDSGRKKLEVDPAEYYLDPVGIIVHHMFFIRRFQERPDLVAGALRISKAEGESRMRKLKKLGLLEEKNGLLEARSPFSHLDKESPICRPYQLLMRQASAAQLQKSKENQMAYSVTFTADDAAFARIQEKYLELLKSIEAIVAPAESKRAFQMNFDLFAWH